MLYRGQLPNPHFKMFFSNLIQSIRPTDRVLEIGPGTTPFPRANEFLEYDFDDHEEAIRQRGDPKNSPEFSGRKVTFYQGTQLPYADDQFDYVIASHVIEHVEDPSAFMAEIFRVGGGRGYIEFPLPAYEYLYDFEVHRHFVWLDADTTTVRFVPKTILDPSPYRHITAELRSSFEMGWDDVVSNNLDFFFCGFEYEKPFEVSAHIDLNLYNKKFTGNGLTRSRQIARKIQRLLG
jgi:SAM-dependent methyltransferase